LGRGERRGGGEAPVLCIRKKREKTLAQLGFREKGLSFFWKKKEEEKEGEDKSLRMEKGTAKKNWVDRENLYLIQRGKEVNKIRIITRVYEERKGGNSN